MLKTLDGSTRKRNANKTILIVGWSCLALTACQPSGTNQNTAANANAALPESTTATAPKDYSVKPPVFANSAPDTAEPVKFPFADFPKVGTTAKAGDYVLAPSYNWIKDAVEKGMDSTRFIWYTQKMATPDKENSELQFLSERRKIPNPYIIAIPPKQTAKKGDIVLTWWQSGSGMQRAIVVDDTDTSAPVVRYLDIDYDNPAKSRDGSTTIGKMDQKILPDSFVKLKEWDAGTIIAVQDGANLKKVHVIRVAGDKVLALGNSKLQIYSKASCRPVPLVPNVQAGERVKAPRHGMIFASATVSSVDTRNGRVFVRFDGDNKDEAIAFGSVLK